MLLSAENLTDFERDLAIQSLSKDENLVLVRHAEESALYVLRPLAGTADDKLVGRVTSRPGVRAVSLNHILRYQTTDPMYAHQWYLKNTGQPFFTGDCTYSPCDGTSDTHVATSPLYDIGWEAISPRYAGRGVKVGVIDSGVDRENPDIAAAVVDAANFVNEYQLTWDFHGHGTLVTSLIAARANNGTGIAGVAPESSVYFVKNATEGGEPFEDATILGIHALTSLGVDVINISSGGPSSNAVYQAAIADALAAGTIVVASAGNNGDRCWPDALGACVTGVNPVLYPAAYPGVVSVGAVDSTGIITEFSTFNQFVTVSAPGKEILGLHTSTLLDTYGGPTCTWSDLVSRSNYISATGATDCYAPYVVWQGTSFAAPIVTGASALMREKYGAKLTPPLFEIALQFASDHPYLSQGQRDDKYGYGRLNLGRLLAFNYPPILVQFATVPQVPVAGQAFEIGAQVSNLEGNADITAVAADLSSIGLSAVTPLAATGDGIFSSGQLTVPSSTAAGTYTITFTARDAGEYVDTKQAYLTIAAAGTTPPPVEVTGSGIDVEITDPNDGDDYVTRKDEVTLKGTMSASVAFLEINGEEIGITPASTEWRAEVVLDDGDNEFNVTAYDLGRQNSAEDSIQIELDRDEPGPVKNLKATGMELTWDAPRGGGIEGYRVYRIDGSKETKITTTTKREATVKTSGKYTVVAEDEAGNKGDIDDAPRVTVGSATNFLDVPPTHFASSYIANLLGRGVIQSGSYYRPDALVTRADFAKLLVLSLGSSSTGSTGFIDVPSTHTLAGYIGAASSRGWVSGQNGLFYPDRPVTRMEAAWMIFRARALRSVSGSRFSDITSVTNKGVANALADAGIMSGQNGLFYPNRLLTRAEAAKIVSAASGG